MAEKILLVSDDEEYAELLKKKLVFLREDDSVVISSYENAINNLEINRPNVVLLLENKYKSETLFTIRNLRKIFDFSIILLVYSVDKEFILSAYDAGIDDYIAACAEDYEFVFRIVKNIKLNSLKLSLQRECFLLEQLRVIDQNTGFYQQNYCKQVVENIIDSELVKDGVFLAFSPTQNAKVKFSLDKMANVIKSLKRNTDVAILGRGTHFFVFMPKTDINGAIVFYNKVKSALDFDICVGISEILNRNFEDFEAAAVKALVEALATNAEYVLAENKTETLNEWLDDDIKEGNYKLFRQIFNKKMNKVIIPVFYRLQKTYEEKLFGTTIEQYTTEEQCVFRLISKNCTSILRIVYPGFAKIMLYIEHEGLDSPENREICIPLTKITQKDLVNIVEDFIKEYKEDVVNRG